MMLKDHGFDISPKTVEAFYENTLGHRYLMLALIEQWINLSTGTGVLAPFSLVRERFLTLMNQDQGIRSLLQRIEQNADVLIQISDLLKGKEVRRRAFRTGPSELELTGLVRSSGYKFVVHNPILSKFLQKHFTAERVLYLLGNNDRPHVVLHYLRTCTSQEESTSQTYRQLYLKTIAEVISLENRDSSADEYLLEALSRIFGVFKAHICHVSNSQEMTYTDKDLVSPDQWRLIRYALRENIHLISEGDPVTIVIPLGRGSQLGEDILLIPGFCQRNNLNSEQDRLKEMERFSKAVIQNRMDHLRAKQFTKLQDLSQDILGSIKQQSILERTFYGLNEILSADASAILFFRINKNGVVLDQIFSVGFDNPTETRQLAEEFAFDVLESQRAMIISEQQGTEVIRVYPVLLRQKCVGVFFIRHNNPYFFREIEDEVVNTILHQTALALSRTSSLPEREELPIVQSFNEPYSNSRHYNSDNMKRILHLSDLHLDTINEANKLCVQLIADLRTEMEITHLHYLVISGDVSKSATKEQFNAAHRILTKLIDKFDLDVRNLIIVPGNHDMNRNMSGEAYSYVPEHRLPVELSREYIPLPNLGALRRDRKLYRQRFHNFSNFVESLVSEKYPLSHSSQGILHMYPENQLLFLALNSSWEVDHYYQHRASVNISSLYNALEKLQDSKYDSWLKIAVWHHPVTGSHMMEKIDFLEQLSIHRFQTVMHGHVHEAIEGYHKYDEKRGLHIIGAGTFGAPTNEQMPGIPFQYNLLTLDTEARSITVETRKKEKADGAWFADARWGDKNNPVPRYTIKLKDWTFAKDNKK
jgi:predicted MPP superfamily phosphohydrolase